MLGATRVARGNSHRRGGAVQRPVATCITIRDGEQGVRDGVYTAAARCRVNAETSHRLGGALVQDAGFGVEAVRVAAAAHHPARHRPQDALQPRQQRRQRIVLRQREQVRSHTMEPDDAAEHSVASPGQLR